MDLISLFIRILTQRRSGAEYAEFFGAACGRGQGEGGGAKVRASGYGVFAEVSPILLTHYINFSDLLKHSAFSASLRLCVKKTSSPTD